MRFTTREMTMIGLFTALHVAAAVMLRLGGEAVVPFSLVPLFVLLAGLLLGRKGAVSLLLYMLLGLMGLPVFAKPPYGGLVYVLQPSFGFVLGYVLAAYIIGRLTEQRQHRTPMLLFAAALAGLVGLYAVGLPYLYLAMRLVMHQTLSWQQVLAFGFLPFIWLDVLKAAVATALALAIGRRVSSLGHSA